MQAEMQTSLTALSEFGVATRDFEHDGLFLLKEVSIIDHQASRGCVAVVF